MRKKVGWKSESKIRSAPLCVEPWHHDSASRGWANDSAQAEDTFGNDNNKSWIPHACTLSKTDGGRIIWRNWKVLVASPTWEAFPHCCHFRVVLPLFNPQETAARDSVLHPDMVATWNPTGGAVKHMDMWPQVHMAPNEGVTIYRLTTRIHSSIWDACSLDLSAGHISCLITRQRKRKETAALISGWHLVGGCKLRTCLH